jgi:hypothetical protein
MMEEYPYDVITEQEYDNAEKALKNGYYGDVNNMFWDGRAPMYIYTCVKGLCIDFFHIDRNESALRAANFNCVLYIDRDTTYNYEGMEVKNITSMITYNHIVTSGLMQIIPILHKWLNAGKKVLIATKGIDTAGMIVCLYATLIMGLPIAVILKKLMDNISPFTNMIDLCCAVALMRRTIYT